LRTQLRRHTFDLNVQSVALEIDIGCAGNHSGATF
jgi:hypothetical protein